MNMELEPVVIIPHTKNRNKKIGIKNFDGKVVMDFDRAVFFVELDKEQALKIAKLLTKKANELTE